MCNSSYKIHLRKLKEIKSKRASVESSIPTLSHNEIRRKLGKSFFTQNKIKSNEFQQKERESGRLRENLHLLNKIVAIQNSPKAVNRFNKHNSRLFFILLFLKIAPA